MENLDNMEKVLPMRLFTLNHETMKNRGGKASIEFKAMIKRLPTRAGEMAQMESCSALLEFSPQ